MKSFSRWIQLLATFTLLTAGNRFACAQVVDIEEGGYSVGTSDRAVLSIKADGSCLFISESTEPRAAAEQQVRMMERFQRAAESGDQDTVAGEGDLSSTNATTPFTDEELTKKLKDARNEGTDESALDADEKLDVVVKKDTVVITTTRSFTSIEEMLKHSDTIWNQGGVGFENARFETDTNGLLRLTLTPRSGMTRYLKTMISEWKLTGAKSEFKLVFPGKVISSDFPETHTNATWLTVDPKNDASLDAMTKLYAAPTVISSESGGLKLDHPLESKSLRQLGRQHGVAGDDLPATEAGPGFIAEAQSITTTTLHVFPGGEDYFKQHVGLAGSQTGAVVNAKLFAPKGRTLLSVSGVRVLSAVDDQGRSVGSEADDQEDVPTEVYFGGSSDPAAMQVQLHLQLPRPDAQAIDDLSAEAIAITAGAWQEMTLTNLQENATNQLDLSGVLPGAKMAITKFKFENGQMNLQIRLQGPRTVQRLDVRAKIPGNDNFNSYSSERRFNPKGQEATRTLTISGYGFDNGGFPSPNEIVLVVRYPKDLRREHLKFELKGLDLL